MNTFDIVELHSNGIHIEILGRTIKEVKIPSGHVPITFAPILGEHFLFSGEKLREGMVVLVEQRFRENPEILSPEYEARSRGFVPSEYDRARVEESSRWAMVMDPKVRGDILSFTAVYSDGTMRARSYNTSIKWATIRIQEFTTLSEGINDCEDCQVVGSRKNEDSFEEEFIKNFLDILKNFE